MRIFWKCQKCSAENSRGAYATNRVDLAMEQGEEIEVQCRSCNNRVKLPVDEFYAKKSQVAMLMAGIIAIFGTMAVFGVVYYFYELASGVNRYYVVGGFMLAPIVIYSLILRQDQQRVSDFNRHKLKS